MEAPYFEKQSTGPALHSYNTVGMDRAGQDISLFLIPGSPLPFKGLTPTLPTLSLWRQFIRLHAASSGAEEKALCYFVCNSEHILTCKLVELPFKCQDLLLLFVEDFGGFGLNEEK